MAIEVLDNLIDKQDGFEIVRDQIAAILVATSADQVAKATTAGKTDPNEWALEVYTERSNAWEKFLNLDNATVIDNLTPIVNVWVDTTGYARGKGDPIKRQQSETVINIDIYGCGISSEDAVGHTPGDQEAALECQIGVRMVRNILMAGRNTYLQLPKETVGVGLRWPQSITFFQPEQGGMPVQHIWAARLSLLVTHNEFSPQIDAEVSEIIGVTITRAEDGLVLLQADYPSTP